MKRTEALLAALVAALLLWCMTSLLLLKPQIDEMIDLSAAKRIFSGEVPYRDYSEHIPPLFEAFYAAVFVLMGGVNVGAARLATHLLVLAGAFVALVALRRHSQAPSWLAWAAALALPCAFFLAWPIALHHWVAIPLAAIAWCVALHGHATTESSRTTLWFVAAGALAGIAGLCTQTHGALAIAASVPFLTDRRRIGAYAVGVVVVLALFVMWLAAAGVLGAFWYASVGWLFSGYTVEGGQNDVGWLFDVAERMKMVAAADAPFVQRASMVAYLVAVIVAVGAAVVAVVVVSIRQRAWRWVPLVVVFFVVMSARPDFVHAAQYGFLPCLAAVLLVGEWRAKPIVVALGVPIVVVTALGGVGQLLVPHALGPRVPSMFRAYDGPILELRGLTELDAQLVVDSNVVRALRRLALEKPDARLFSAPLGALGVVFALAPAGTTLYLFHPSVGISRPHHYAQTADALEKRPADVVVITDRAFWDEVMSPPPSSSPEWKRLAERLRTDYAIVQEAEVLWLLPQRANPG